MDSRMLPQLLSLTHHYCYFFAVCAQGIICLQRVLAGGARVLSSELSSFFPHSDLFQRSDGWGGPLGPPSFFGYLFFL